MGRSTRGLREKGEQGVQGESRLHTVLRAGTVANGVYEPVSHAYLVKLGWELILTKGAYLCDLPKRGTLIACLSRHNIAVKDGTLFDSWDSRKSKRTKCGSPVLKGYYFKPVTPKEDDRVPWLEDFFKL